MSDFGENKDIIIDHFIHFPLISSKLEKSRVDKILISLKSEGHLKGTVEWLGGGWCTQSFSCSIQLQCGVVRVVTTIVNNENWKL